MSLGSVKKRLLENPFYVLGVAPDASRSAIEREGQKLLGMLELGLKAARRYSTPVGPGERTVESVRQAMAELRDPDKRLAHELWARLEPNDVAEPTGPERTDATTWNGALSAFGWGPR